MLALLTPALLGWNCVAIGYPLYGSEERGILRLQQARLAHEGSIPGRQKVSGELLPLEAVDLAFDPAQALIEDVRLKVVVEAGVDAAILVGVTGQEVAHEQFV